MDKAHGTEHNRYRKGPTSTYVVSIRSANPALALRFPIRCRLTVQTRNNQTVLCRTWHIVIFEGIARIYA